MDETFEFHTAQAASFKSNLRGHENFRIKFRPGLRHAMQHSTEVREHGRKFRAPGVPQLNTHTHTCACIYIYFFPPIFFTLFRPPHVGITTCSRTCEQSTVLSSWKVYYVYSGEIHAATRRNLACQRTVNFRAGGEGLPGCIKFCEQSISPVGSPDDPVNLNGALEIFGLPLTEPGQEPESR